MAILVSENPRPKGLKPENIPYIEGRLLYVATSFLEVALDPGSLEDSGISLERCRYVDSIHPFLGRSKGWQNRPRV
jgi:hypothetical protein